MNAVLASLATAYMEWQCWNLSLADATDKFNKLHYSVTGRSPQDKLFNQKNLRLHNVFIFGQVRFIRMMDRKSSKSTKSWVLCALSVTDRGQDLIVETEDYVLKGCRGSDFHQYCTEIDLVVIFRDAWQTATSQIEKPKMKMKKRTTKATNWRRRENKRQHLWWLCRKTYICRKTDKY